jgi:glucose-1-phosphate thymidylyltransferase
LIEKIQLDNLFVDIIGIIPAAGRGTRISPLPVSKELFPVGFQHTLEPPRPKVVSHYLLEQMVRADIKRCFIVLGHGKWDIPAYFGHGESIGIDLAYSVIRNSPGTPFTLDTVFPFVSDKIVALGFPDILFETEDVYCRLLNAFQENPCDVMLGLFPADHPHLLDMVAFTAEGVVERIDIKPTQTSLTHTWGAALWTPQFTQFMHDWLAAINLDSLGAHHGYGELSVGDVVQAAIEAGLKVKSVKVSEKAFLDIGTPHNLIRAIYERTPQPKDI